MSKAMTFSIYVGNEEQAVKFYSEVLGWKIEKFPGGSHYMVNAGPDDEPGISGFIEPREGNREKNVEKRSTVNHYRITSYENVIKTVKKLGGKVLDEFEMGEMGRHATCEDPEGNVFAVMWENPNFNPPPPK
jgi:predicted enzyme related to lactoylglutathione lyase